MQGLGPKAGRARRAVVSRWRTLTKLPVGSSAGPEVKAIVETAFRLDDIANEFGEDEK